MNSIATSVFDYEEISNLRFEEKRFDLSLIGEEGKRHYDFIKDFNTCIFNHALSCGR